MLFDSWLAFMNNSHVKLNSDDEITIKEHYREFFRGIQLFSREAHSSQTGKTDKYCLISCPRRSEWNCGFAKMIQFKSERKIDRRQPTKNIQSRCEPMASMPRSWPYTQSPTFDLAPIPTLRLPSCSTSTPKISSVINNNPPISTRVLPRPNPSSSATRPPKETRYTRPEPT